MKLFSGFRYAATFAFFLLFAASAFAQFEVSPDHFDRLQHANTQEGGFREEASGANQFHPWDGGRQDEPEHGVKSCPGTSSGKALAGHKVSNYGHDGHIWHASRSAADVGWQIISGCAKLESASIASTSGVTGKAKAPSRKTGLKLWELRDEA